MTSLRASLAAIVSAFACSLAPAAAPCSPPDGADAPPFSLKDLSGQTVTTASIAPRTMVLIFGEFGHDGAKRACEDVLEVLGDPRLANCSAVPIFIVAEDGTDAQLKEKAAQGRFPPLILHDAKRDAFGAYKVLVVPTIVVVDGNGKVVHSMPGFLQRFKEILTESVLVAAGKETREELALTIENKTKNASHEVVRAERLVHLGVELTRHGLYDLAEPKFTEAISLAPGSVSAKLGLADLMLRQNRTSDAEPLYKSVLTANPESVDAQLGIAEIQIRRGGDETAKADETLRKLIAKDARNARAHYLSGQICERRGDTAAAAAEYKKSAELAMER